MNAHLLFLWCSMWSSDPAMLRYQDCNQDIAFKSIDGGELLPSEDCGQAMMRWIKAHGQPLYAHNMESLAVVCEPLTAAPHGR